MNDFINEGDITRHLLNLRLRFDTRDSETIATLYGIPVDVDDSIEPGEIGYVVEEKL